MSEPTGMTGHDVAGYPGATGAVKPRRDGGPAFPWTIRNDGDDAVDFNGLLTLPPNAVAYSVGMSMRDYFAAAALSEGLQLSAKMVAARAFEIADAMLAERDR